MDLFTLSGSASVKAVRRMLMKSSPGLIGYFFNICRLQFIEPQSKVTGLSSNNRGGVRKHNFEKISNTSKKDK